MRPAVLRALAGPAGRGSALGSDDQRAGGSGAALEPASVLLTGQARAAGGHGGEAKHGDVESWMMIRGVRRAPRDEGNDERGTALESWSAVEEKGLIELEWTAG